ncbi:Uncharacterised protein [uncultured archaeon]|nr:Uncharacterised protein [uncultured archaeon]
MTAFTENIRKIMGWCPQKTKFSITEKVFIQDNTYNSKKSANTGFLDGINVQVQIFDRLILAIFLALTGLILIGSAWAGTFRYVFVLAYILCELLFILFQTKLSVNNATFRISSFLKNIVIPINSVNSVVIFENPAKKYKLGPIVFTLFFISLILNAIETQNPVMKNLYIIAIFGMAYVSYSMFRISGYPKIIKIKADEREILVYPRNDYEFFLLKDIASDDKRNK